jgi:signal transduction histidine kinase
VVHGNAPLYAEIDAFRIGQLLRNLLSNAIKFSPAGAPVQIDLAIDTAANLCLSVRDFGPGVPAAEQEQIFNTFIQSSLTKTGAGGTGLGLAICREIVHAHRGRIEILPVAGRGAHFRVTLPRGSVGASEESA